MNKVLKFILGILILIGLAIAVYFLVSPKSGNESSTEVDSSLVDSRQADRTQTPEADKETVSESNALLSTLKKAGIGCSLNESNDSECSYEGIQYTINGPTDWQTDFENRNQACEQGFVNPNFQILERSGVYYFTTDNNLDLSKLQKVLAKNDLELEIVQYCS